jgi:hypothetical protein
MTYIPSLLVFGLVTLTLCVIAVVGFTVYSRHSISRRSMRIVDGLRFIVDFAEAIQDDKAFVDVSTWSRARL